MGDEISKAEFEPADFTQFEERLEAETAHLGELFDGGGISDEGYTWGFELEAWLLDHNYFPNPVNEEVLAALDNPDVVPELSRFNLELNTPVRSFSPQTFSEAENALSKLWTQCNSTAHALDTNMVMIGTLPTIRDADLSLDNMSPMKRFYALNHELLKANRGRPLDVDIRGREHLSTRHADVMLEAAATSYQIHLKVPASLAHHYFNASQAISAPILAAGVNSPLLFDHLLWDETRIPLFEQSIVGASGPSSLHPRVVFDHRYLQHSLLKCFADNLSEHSVLLPIHFDEDLSALRHLRLHNGTIWRWNRPLVGTHNGELHFRLEHRALPAGPSLVDMIANTALYLGAVHEWVMAERARPIEALTAHANFYAAAREGLDAKVRWAGRDGTARTWLLDSLLADADAGLARFGISRDERDHYLGIIEARVSSGNTGANWQREFYLANDRHAYKLMAAYCEWQRSGLPVHEWLPGPGPI